MRIKPEIEKQLPDESKNQKFIWKLSEEFDVILENERVRILYGTTTDNITLANSLTTTNNFIINGTT